VASWVEEAPGEYIVAIQWLRLNRPEPELKTCSKHEMGATKISPTWESLGLGNRFDWNSLG
jgi:hypothetical protein